MIVTRGMGPGPQMLITRGYGLLRRIVEVVSRLVEAGGGHIEWPLDQERTVVELVSSLAKEVVLKSPVRMCQAMKSLVGNKVSLKSAVHGDVKLESKVAREAVELDSRVDDE